MDCLFCKIANHEIPSTTVYEDDTVIAFRDIAPVAPTHILIVPKMHIACAAELTADHAAVTAHMLEIVPQIAKAEGLCDFRLVINNGKDAGQTVFHLHMHLLGGRPLGEMG